MAFKIKNLGPRVLSHDQLEELKDIGMDLEELFGQQLFQVAVLPLKYAPASDERIGIVSFRFNFDEKPRPLSERQVVRYDDTGEPLGVDDE